MKRALVLGGGGVTGIAWHLGLLCGLQRAGLPLGDADTIIGTSAGSVVGTLLAAGVDLEAAVAAQQVEAAAPPRSGGSGRGTSQWLAAMSVLIDPSVPAQQARAQVGTMASAADTTDEQTWLRRIGDLLPIRDWPQGRDLRLVVVDTADGRDVVLDAAAGAPLLQAVAASCAVPGLMPPVTIGEHRFMDGGVRLGAGADLAAGADRLIVIAPMAMLGRERIEAEMAAAGAAGSLLIEPDQEALEAFGPNFMDPARRAPSVAAGLRQAEELADAVRGVWR
ncbi:patatin [Actinoplanes sp. SE50]|uniref:patatin-like phospholipase family protein n=1 Tax=unclassified Actinoplanes TaxID=2626549 RepID=UPI00023ED24A|nr:MULTISPECIES: patatin-like phospholipase family protein [unclassified Actinoplanes]AEV84948.1 Lysophospholipase NTE1 [Actinoplanes sp. SE50/110]ATO83339.1 patatin [Actinoplanes sp. SE50]SLM00746.1 patatin [Actinoplanes sp. SE50/110]